MNEEQNDLDVQEWIVSELIIPTTQGISVAAILMFALHLFIIVVPSHSEDIVDRKIFRTTLRDCKDIDSIKVFGIDKNCYRRVAPLKNDTSYCVGSPRIENYPAEYSVTVIDKSKIKRVIALVDQRLVESPKDVILCEDRVGAIVTYSRGVPQLFEYDDAAKYLETKRNNESIIAYVKSDLWRALQHELHVTLSKEQSSNCSD